MQATGIASRRYADWLARSIVSGFVATAVMTFTLLLGYVLALGFANLIRTDTASGQEVANWFRGLTVNHLVDFTQAAPYTALALHLLIGLLWAGLYGYVVQPWLIGPQWVRGVQFSLVLWVLSLTVFFPLVGAGFLGLGLGAGPLPILGNLIAHIAYGATLGVVYGPLGDVVLGERVAPSEAAADVGSEVMGARGIILGVLVGVLVGMMLNALAGGNGVVGLPPLAIILAAALVGGAMGELIGSWLGLSVETRGG
ncbi:MAG: hypothetical protein HY689_11630 [Chloroflexi bacterium]|nr:hypothetical protein [Chloroflexota bacterium]